MTIQHDGNDRSGKTHLNGVANRAVSSSADIKNHIGNAKSPSDEELM